MFDADDRKKAINNLVLVFRQSDGLQICHVAVCLQGFC
jgi:hypothetical protein